MESHTMPRVKWTMKWTAQIKQSPHIRRPRSNNQTQHPTRYKKIFLTHPLLLQIHTFYKNLPNPNPTHELSEIRRRFLFPQVRTFVSVSRIFETLGSWFFVISVKAENLVLWFCVWIWTTCSYWFVSCWC